LELHTTAAATTTTTTTATTHHRYDAYHRHQCHDGHLVRILAYLHAAKGARW
jgi:hypothetical protein